MNDESHVTVGLYEKVSFPKMGEHNVLAKIDTGAYSGALHCSKVTLKRDNRGELLVFSPFDRPEIELKTRNFRKGKVKSSNGDVEERYFVRTRMILQEKEYQVTLSLSDRSQMQYEVLIGSRFLRQHNIIVDVSKS